MIFVAAMELAFSARSSSGLPTIADKSIHRLPTCCVVCETSNVSDETKPNSLPFLAIFPDTNIFLPNWPAEPPGLADLLSTARIFQIPVYLLETVELELEAHWIREARGGIDKLKAQKDKLPPPLSDACRIEVPTLSEAVLLYQRMATVTKTKLALDHAAFPETSLRELYQMAIGHEHPFAAEGKNFPDAVIVTSVLDFSRRQNLSRVAFVSKNCADFDRTKLMARAALYGVDLQYYRDLNALHDALWPFLKGALQKAWQEDNEAAKEALELARASLQTFLISQLVKSEDVELELVKIEEVRVAWWDKVTQKLQRVPLQFTVNARFKTTTYAIERGVTIDGWAVNSDEGYECFDFESAFISR
jgi:PIN domain